jgi:hypothetical protein
MRNCLISVSLNEIPFRLGTYMISILGRMVYSNFWIALSISPFGTAPVI